MTEHEQQENRATDGEKGVKQIEIERDRERAVQNADMHLQWR